MAECAFAAHTAIFKSTLIPSQSNRFRSETSLQAAACALRIGGTSWSTDKGDTCGLGVSLSVLCVEGGWDGYQVHSSFGLLCSSESHLLLKKLPVVPELGVSADQVQGLSLRALRWLRLDGGVQQPRPCHAVLPPALPGARQTCVKVFLNSLVG